MTMIKKILEKPMLWLSVLFVNQIVIILTIHQNTDKLGIIISYIGNTLFVLCLWAIFEKIKNKK